MIDMNPGGSLVKAYKRYRHSKGFGIHSPFAYRFVTDVLNPGQYGYYAYDNLPVSLNSNDEKETKRLIRLAVFLKTKRFLVYPESSKSIRAAAKALGLKSPSAISSSFSKFGKDDLLIVSGRVIPLEIIDNAISKHASILALNPDMDLRTSLEKPRQKGLLFSGKNRILLIPRQEMYYIAYDINL